MLKNQGNKALETWFGPVQLEKTLDTEQGRLFQLTVPNELYKYWISENLLDQICSEISSLYEGLFKVEVVVRDEEGPTFLQQAEHSTLPVILSQDNFPRTDLNPAYTFQTFVVCRHNEFAHAASHSVAENPGYGYNPLFVCGPTGMGKTHLLHAIGNYVNSRTPDKKIRYVSAERFLTEFVSSIQRKQMQKFQQKYRDSCDVLLMDDVQVLSRGQQIQEEFFHTLNSFFDAKKQVVVASDRMPQDITGLEDRIRTRLEWGLVADIQMPDFEARLAILRYKAEQQGIYLSDEIINYVANISRRSIRELEGNLNKIKMYAELQNIPITFELAKKILSSHVTQSGNLTVEEIQRLSAAHFSVRINDLKSANRSKPLVVARQVAMYLVKKHLEKSLVEIGRAFGGKDHTTVLNALRRIENQLEQNTELRKDIEELDRRINNITGV